MIYRGYILIKITYLSVMKLWGSDLHHNISVPTLWGSDLCQNMVLEEINGDIIGFGNLPGKKLHFNFYTT